MFDSMNMHMPVVIIIVVVLLALLFAGFLIAIRVVGARIQNQEASGTQPEAEGPQSTGQPNP